VQARSIREGGFITTALPEPQGFQSLVVAYTDKSELSALQIDT